MKISISLELKPKEVKEVIELLEDRTFRDKAIKSIVDTLKNSEKLVHKY